MCKYNCIEFVTYIIEKIIFLFAKEITGCILFFSIYKLITGIN